MLTEINVNFLNKVNQFGNSIQLTQQNGFYDIVLHHKTGADSCKNIVYVDHSMPSADRVGCLL